MIEDLVRARPLALPWDDHHSGPAGTGGSGSRVVVPLQTVAADIAEIVQEAEKVGAANNADAGDPVGFVGGSNGYILEPALFSPLELSLLPLTLAARSHWHDPLDQAPLGS